MPRSRILFDNYQKILFKPDLDSLVTPANQNGFLSFTLDNWRKEQITEIFIFTNNTENTGTYRFITAARQLGFNVSKIPLDLLYEDDIHFFHKLNFFIKDRLKKNSGIFLYNKGDEPYVMRSVANFLLSINPRGKFSAPENVIEYLFQRKNIIPADRSIFEYKQHLDRSYRIPTTMQNMLNGHVPSPEELGSFNTFMGDATSPPPSRPAPAPTSTPGPAPAPSPAPKQAAAPAPKSSPPPTTKFGAKSTTAQNQFSPEIHNEVVTLEPTVSHSGQSKPPSTPRAASTGTPRRPEGDFHAAKFLNIRNKLLLITTTIISLALGTMIIVASYFFRTDSELRINDFSLNKTELTGRNIESDLENLSFMALNASSSLMQKFSSNAERLHFRQLFFENNRNIIFLGVARNMDGRLDYVNSIINTAFLDENNLPTSQIENIPQQHADFFLKAINGIAMVKNVSPGLSVPVMGLGLPFGRAGERYVVTILVDSTRFLSAIRSRDIIKTFLVDSEGVIIVHEDGNLVLEAKDFSETPIVKKMMESKIDNEQIKYQSEEGDTNIGIFKKLAFGGLGVISTVKEEEAFKAVSTIQQRNMYITGIILCVAILIIFFFARTLTVPVKRLVQAAQQVKEGDYNLDIEATTRDEIGSLTHTFANMAVGLSEREKMKDAFGRFVNKHVAEMVLGGDVELGGENKHCAVFFSDLRGFTAMSEQMTPEQVVIYLNEYFQDMVQCVIDTHGIVDKYIGDAIMAHWGALDSFGNDTENAVNAALFMREALIRFNQNVTTHHPFAKFGCGINTGEVISGQIGSSERMEFTIIGDAVNLASRIEQLNKPFGTDILISEDSYRLVQNIFNVEKMPSIKVKGKSEQQTIYAVLGRKDDPQCPKNMVEVRKRTGGDPPTVDLENYSEAKEEKFEVL